MFRYNGYSMCPTIKVGDVLKVVHYGDNRINLGDVVVFRCRSGKNLVVHRVVAFTPEGIKTKGDNNPVSDQRCLSPEDIIGRVVSISGECGNKDVPGGWRGYSYVLSLQLRKKVFKVFTKFVRFPYHFLAKVKILRCLLPFLPTIRIQTFCRAGVREFHLFMGDRFIGRCRPGSRQWQITRPYRLFVDEAFFNEISDC